MKSIGNEFLQWTKHRTMPTSAEKAGAPTPPIETSVEGPRIDLPSVDTLKVPDLSLDAAFNARQSHRAFKDSAVALSTLSYLLHVTQGVRKAGKKATLRYAPSAGARHAFECYIAVKNVEGLSPGIYRYLAMEHALVNIREGDVSQRLSEVCEGQAFVGAAPMTILWVANAYRMTHRYSTRGYRYLFMDAGHAVENLYLASTMFQGGTVAVGAYDDDAANALLDLDGSQRFVIYITPFGHV